MHRLAFHLTFIAALVISLSSVRADDDEYFKEIQNKITSFALDNGRTIILYSRGSAPVISCVTYVKTGSVDEVAGITGIAHQLEHLAFKGTAHVGTKNFEAEKNAIAEIDKLYEKIQAFELK